MKQQKQINICKNFTDTLAFVAAAFALIAVLLAKENFEPTEKILKFWQDETTKSYIILGAVFLFSALFSVLSRKIPSLALPTSVTPLWFACCFYDNELLPKRPMVFILLGLVHFAGCLIHVGQWLADSRDFSKNTLKAAAAGFVHAAVSLALWLVPKYLLKYRWRLQLTTAFYLVTVLGAASAALGIVWYILTPKAERKEYRLWNAVTALACCILVWGVRFLLEKLGIRTV